MEAPLDRDHHGVAGQADGRGAQVALLGQSRQIRLDLTGGRLWVSVEVLARPRLDQDPEMIERAHGLRLPIARERAFPGTVDLRPRVIDLGLESGPVRQER